MISSSPVLFTIIAVFSLQAMLFSALILSKKPRRLANIFLAILVLFYALIPLNIVVVNVLKDYDLLHVFRYIQMEMLFGIGPCLYFYTKCITQPKFKFQKKHFIHFVPLVLEFIFFRTSIYRIGADGLYEQEMPLYSYVYLTEQWLGLISILMYSFISFSILLKYKDQLKAYYSKIENLSHKWLQTPIIIFAGFFIYWQILTEIDRFVFDKLYREYYFLPNFVLLSIITCWLGFRGYIQKEREVVLLKPETKETKHKHIDKDEAFLTRLKTLMKTKKPYLDPELNLSMLAELLDMKPKELSAKINQNCQQNFYDLINSYRIEDFKHRLKSSERHQYSLLGHAYECGFNSKSTFNHVFKKITQLTPSQYLKSIKNTSR
ncbi:MULTISPECIES: helix-turn-helix domain-containing protein [Maribacter]|uniref:Helix-turn-helix domain-containing protein n=1 Tax=Maribacter flavus TaxID=1658664 RepID=A0ABU7IHS8_9FLAO|nr:MULTISPECIES: helix-turn-helix domain-containing protein [Maribacter]MDC6405061.1 helix-turn-helix domain-containing protein [Maribacter sp. PR66]MEE1972475.1 helix-turn-helix domain-containing protein [Maribacter flavus]